MFRKPGGIGTCPRNRFWGKTTMSLMRISTGKRGEELAADYLAEAGYRIIERNYRCLFGEIDIVAEEGRRWFSSRSRAGAPMRTEIRNSLSVIKSRRRCQGYRSIILRNGIYATARQGLMSWR